MNILVLLFLDFIGFMLNLHPSLIEFNKSGISKKYLYSFSVFL